ncbi:hypothetical protein CEXT_521841 [Caerostris extrusa]|uniref:Uncharacterized protein n=1 Tax=Caerostris extrusa TaxID=172846 RepID=A0AAV4Y0Y8_CAEEX|nr:hypothetical protein CEXT_521841 [Caerostris extrusa]
MFSRSFRQTPKQTTAKCRIFGVGISGEFLYEQSHFSAGNISLQLKAFDHNTATEAISVPVIYWQVSGMFLWKTFKDGKN